MSGGDCLATVTSDDFAIGTLVMLHSFRRNNPWFGGEILVIHDGLGEAARAMLEPLPGVRLAAISGELRAAVDWLVAARPGLANRRARFGSLDAFRGAGYDRLLFCDSDLLFCGDVGAMFDQGAPVCAAADGAWLRGHTRDARAFAEVARDAPDALPVSFNAGLIAADRSVLGEGTWRALLDGLAPDAWTEIVSGHTDQIVLNREFAGQVALVGPEYNALLLHPDEAVGPAAAKVLHFNGPAKPWAWDRHAAAIARDPAMLDALRKWYAAYVEALAAQHFAARHPR